MMRPKSRARFATAAAIALLGTGYALAFVLLLSRPDEKPLAADEPTPGLDVSTPLRELDARLARIERRLAELERLLQDLLPGPERDDAVEITDETELIEVVEKVDTAPPSQPLPAGPRPPITPSVREKLERGRRDVRFRQSELRDVVAALRKATGLPFVLHASLRHEEDELAEACETVTIELPSATIRELLEAIADASGRDSPGDQICFVFRRYGIVLAPRRVAETLRGATIPSDVGYRGR